jgi:hypothetical protein
MLSRRRPFRAAAGVSKLAGEETCSRCHRPARFLSWCRLHAEDEADRRVGRFVKRRDGACVICGERRPWELEWAHVLGRRYKRIRWSPQAAVTLCVADHRYLDGHPEEKRAVFRERFPGLLETLEREKDSAPLPDLVEILETYRRAG